MITPQLGACTCPTSVRGSKAFSECTCELGALIDTLLKFAYNDDAQRRAQTAYATEQMARVALQNGRRAAVGELLALGATQARVGAILGISEARVGQLAKASR